MDPLISKMRLKKTIIQGLMLCGLLMAFLSIQAKEEDRLDNVFNHLSEPEKQIFLKKLPKGGDIHFHLDGSATPEAMLKLKTNFCINKKTLAAEQGKNCQYESTRALSQNPDAYEKVVKAWSMKNFYPGKESAHDHFFATFGKFMAIALDKKVEILNLLRKEASLQNTLYLEPIITPDDNEVLNYSYIIDKTPNFDNAISKLIANKAFNQHINTSVSNVKSIFEASNEKLKCPEKVGCDVTIRFQYYVLREQPIDKVITQATAAFMTADKSPYIVGINFVQAEDGILALKDYKKHMSLLGKLHKRFPKVKISLHAGELNEHIVSREELGFHIHDAIFKGYANRIGHGTDIVHEDKVTETLKVMHDRKIPVEINLSSNESILNIKGKSHPFTLYLAKGVPVVLSTDDEGILRTNLTREYFLASKRYQLSYPVLKKLSRNSLYYSFLPGKSLWVNDDYKKMRSGCSPSSTLKSSCAKLLKQSLKAKRQMDLEFRFNDFESAYLKG